MADGATSQSALVQAQLDRLAQLSTGKDILGHQRLSRQLAALGNPHQHLPPVFHIAGTNGKGSVCAYLRAAIEAEGGAAHVFTSPHLVRLNERIRLAGALVSDDALAALLAETLDATAAAAAAAAEADKADEPEADDAADSAADTNGNADPNIGPATTFFETIAAAAFLGFARSPADAAIIEVGLGGRLDATNIIAQPAICGIAQIGPDHQEFLGDSLAQIAAEKAAIAKPGVPLVCMAYPPDIAAAIAETAAERGAKLYARAIDWDARLEGERLIYEDARGRLALPRPVLAGAHQADNAALAIAMARHQRAYPLSEAALSTAMETARWPGRMEPLQAGPVMAQMPAGSRTWVDGAHNIPAMAAALNFFGERLEPGERLHIIIGLLTRKDAAGIFAIMQDFPCALLTVPVPSAESYAPEALAQLARAHGLAATSYETLTGALSALPAPAPKVLITGSLYLAGAVLAANTQAPE